MATDQIANYLQSLRRRSGFSQSELAHTLGIVSQYQVSRHERSLSAPTLHAALGYEALFRKPVAEIFPGFYETISAGIEDRILAMTKILQDSSVKGRQAEPIARKLEFICERLSPESSNATPTR
jgi:transcriptional regulator with XRE-family HTH domain